MYDVTVCVAAGGKVLIKKIFFLVFACLASTYALGAGFVCPDVIQYDSCNPGSYRPFKGNFEGVPKEGNDCTECPSNASCVGGTQAPRYKVTMNVAGGNPTPDAFYASKNGFFKGTSTDSATLSSVDKTAKEKYVFNGYYSASSGGTMYADSSGKIQDSLKNITSPTTIYAQWKDCEAGYYCDGADVDKQQKQCTTKGAYCPKNSASEGVCPGGSYCQTSSEKKLCGAGHYCPEKSTEQTKCSEGTYNPDSGQASIDACKACEAGTYNDAKGQASCKACGQGHYCDGSGLTAPLNCPAGTYTDKYNLKKKEECSPCPKGKYNKLDGQISEAACLSCAPGTYNDATGKTECKNCGAGYYCKDEGMDHREQCTAGADCYDEQETANETCPVNYYCPSPTDATAPQPCTSGYYCPEGAYRTTQTECEAGNYCPNTATQTKCDGDCDYCPSGSVEPQKCEAGYYCSDSATRKKCEEGQVCPACTKSPQSCSPGYYCDGGSEKLNCKAGYYCDGDKTTYDDMINNKKCPLATTSDIKATSKQYCYISESTKFKDRSNTPFSLPISDKTIYYK